MMYERTPGPWAVVERRIPHYMGGEHVSRSIYTTWDHPQMKGPLPVACESFGIGAEKGGKGVQFIHIGEDDARLMAAAPELLEALKLCAAVCSGEVMHKNGLIRALEAARSAIEKATDGAKNPMRSHEDSTA
jgi:hypothetical protein